MLYCITVEDEVHVFDVAYTVVLPAGLEEHLGIRRFCACHERSGLGQGEPSLHTSH